jgi:hypothetical protein
VRETWYAHPNDLIGGWSVMRVDTTPGQVPAGVRGEVANFISEVDAREIAWLHNFTNPPLRALWRYFAMGLAGGFVGGALGAAVVRVLLL